MGDRYYLNVKCPKCGHEERDVYYAPTRGFLFYHCEKCNHKIDLEKYSGIDAVECATTDEGREHVLELKEKNKQEVDE